MYTRAHDFDPYGKAFLSRAQKYTQDVEEFEF
jgi:hypothetical protein